MGEINYFDEMIIDCFIIYAGSKKTIKNVKDVFNSTGVELGNVIFYELNKKTIKNKLIRIDDKSFKQTILKELHIL